ncbi:MAG: PIN domain-containing protein [Bryobacterales bacterium]|nr:PIN domain-containing protein [Bryobacterales bacterium]
MNRVVYDASVLVAADKYDRLIWIDHRVRLEAGVVPLVPAPVVAQVSRSPKQAQLRRFLQGCEIVPFDESQSHQAGWLFGRSKTKDVVDASVVTLAIRHNAVILTSDTEDIGRLIRPAGHEIAVVAV